jgi:EAL domain-containing protein (putative c-di-GMP-specific phosphodiesterase class I)
VSQQTNSEVAESLRTGRGFRAVTLPLYELAEEKLIGYEMLSRGPSGLLEKPDEFFKVSIESKILTQVDLHCFKTCLDAAEQLKRNLRFHLNLFPSTIIETDAQKILDLFPKDIEEGKYCIEIHEHQRLNDSEALLERVCAFRKAGLKVGIDDVGFGASSLEGLIVLEPDIIKIDQKYVTGAWKDPARTKHLKRLVNVAKALDAELAAEGINTVEDLELLRVLDVDYGQGVFWGELL